MKRSVRRVGLVATALAAIAALTSAPANAADDFADCPALPAGAKAGTWTCYSMTASDTLVRFNKMSAHTTAPIRLTVAQGKLTSGATSAKVGALRADPIPFVSGLPGTPLEIPHPTGWKLQIGTTGLIEPGMLVPHKLGLTARVAGTDLGAACTVGPATIEPRVQWALPGLLGTYMKVYDSVYALPAATGCAGHDFGVNTLIGLPANATSNHFQANWFLRSKAYS